MSPLAGMTASQIEQYCTARSQEMGGRFTPAQVFAHIVVPVQDGCYHPPSSKAGQEGVGVDLRLDECKSAQGKRLDRSTPSRHGLLSHPGNVDLPRVTQTRRDLDCSPATPETRNQTPYASYNAHKCHSSSRRSLLWGKALRAWNLDFSIEECVNLLCGRAVYRGWTDEMILGLLDDWRDQHDLEVGADWPKRVQAALSQARATTRPWRAPRTQPKAATATWQRIQTVLSAGAILTPAEIERLTGIALDVIHQQLRRKRKMGWVEQPAYGMYRLTALAGTEQPTPAGAAETEQTIPEILAELDRLQSKLADRRSENRAIRAELDHPAVRRPRGKAWTFMPLAVKETFLALFAIPEPSRRFRATSWIEDEVAALEDVLQARGYVRPEPQYDLDDLDYVA